MTILGAHMSIGGGFDKAVERAHAVTCRCLQIFTKNNNQWRARDITPQEVLRFQQRMSELGITNPLSHSSYLINLASPDQALWQKSVDAFAIEMQRAALLGIPYVVLHPGSFTTSTEEDGIARIALGLDAVHDKIGDLSVCCLLENTAGQGSAIGWKFEQLSKIMEATSTSDRLGVCLDTCHAFAAGYDMRNQAGYAAMISELDASIGVETVKAFHLNDSKKELGSRVDRHEHIGEGFLGLEPFRLLLNDRQFRKIPMYLETPKGMRDDEDWDVVNLTTLRGLVDE